MATTGRADESEPVAASCRDAEFVGLVGAPDGDALAAVGLLGRALAPADVPFHARLGATEGETEADCSVAVGTDDDRADHCITGTADRSASERARAVAAELAEADAALALSGRVAAGHAPRGCPLADEFERQPGVAVPTGDLADGLAHTTLVHASFSGDRAAAAAALGDLELGAGPDEADRRRVASLLAFAVAGDERAPPRAATAVERALHPHVGGPFETIQGYADVLDALARTCPGLGVAVALGRAAPDAALEAWREHGRHVHEVVGGADLERRGGLAVAGIDGPPAAPVARLLRDFRSPAQAVLVVGETRSALATTADGPDAASVLAAAAEGGAGVRGHSRLASGAVDDEEAVIAAAREGR